MSQGVQTGTIKRVLKGYGFIAPDGGEKDVFFHANELSEGVMFDNLREGDKVQFEMGEGKKGPMAMNVMPMSQAAAA